MPKKKIIRGWGECGYRFCKLPGRQFKKKKGDQKFCCPDHRVKEWNLQHPRMSEDAKKQCGLDLGVLPEVPVMKMREKPIIAQLADGLALKEKGQKQVAAHSKGFVTQMRHIAVRIAREKGHVTSDDLRAEAVKLGIVPHHPNAWGIIFIGSEFEMIGRKKSEFKGNRAREIKIWGLVKHETTSLG